MVPNLVIWAAEIYEYFVGITPCFRTVLLVVIETMQYIITQMGKFKGQCFFLNQVVPINKINTI